MDNRLTFELKNTDGLTTLYLIGKVDTLGARIFEKKIKEVLAQDIKNLKFNFKGVEYLSSSGLRIILYTKKEMQKRNPDSELIIEDPQKQVVDVLSMTGFLDEVVEVEYTGDKNISG
ncbi:MAG: STAS domain-containing protein [Clostridia bacterium]|nr:STAS domain-containing protein [Clostridia bacterium]